MERRRLHQRARLFRADFPAAFSENLDGLEQKRALEAQLEGRPYTFLLDAPYRWESWAAPKDAGGRLDHDKALTGPDLIEFINSRLFPYLHGFKSQSIDRPNTVEYKIREIFGEIKNRILSGFQGVKLPSVKSLQIPVPCLPKQQRIVAVPDGAFAGLATAQAHAEKNLQNARALFESHLQSVFTHRGKGWVEKRLD